MAGGTRRTDVQIVCDTLAEVETQTLHETALAKLLVAQRGWTMDKAYKAIRKGLADPQVPLHRDPGYIIIYRGTERGGAGTDAGIYTDVKRVLAADWAVQRRYGPADVRVTARTGSRGSGTWTHPDLTLVCDPRGRTQSKDVPMLVSFEVETASGFDVRSVYQAYEQGRGADYSYVVYPGRPHDSLDWVRIEGAARQLGVGLYEFRKPGLWSSWEQVLRARYRDPTGQDRALFVRDALGGVLDWPKPQ